MQADLAEIVQASDRGVGSTHIGELWPEGSLLQAQVARFHPLSATFPLLSALAADDSVLWLFTQFQHSCKLLAGRAPAWAVLGWVPSGVACTRCTCGGCLSVLADVGADGRETSPREEGKGFPLIYFCLLIIE